MQSRSDIRPVHFERCPPATAKYRFWYGRVEALSGKDLEVDLGRRGLISAPSGELRTLERQMFLVNGNIQVPIAFLYRAFKNFVEFYNSTTVT